MKPKSYEKLPDKFLGYYPVFITLFILLLVLNYVGILFNYEYTVVGPIILSFLLIIVFGLQLYYISRQQVHLTEKERERTINSILFGIIISDSDSKITQINHMGCEILGIKHKSATSIALDDSMWGMVDKNGNLLDKQDIPISITLNTCKPVEKVIVGAINLRFQNPIWLEVSTNPIFNKDKQVEAVVLVFNEITDQFNSIRLLNERNEQLRQITFTDYLSKIPNLRYFNSYLTEVWLDSKKTGTPVTLFLIEIDYTKEFNKKDDFHFRDRVLMDVAKRLSEEVNQQGVVARIEGKQFGVIYSGLFGKQIQDKQSELEKSLLQLPKESKLESCINEFEVLIGTSTRVATGDLDYYILIEEAIEELRHTKVEILG